MKCIDTAFNWHGGGGSALYQFASTRKIHSENHRDDILDEIDECISWNKINGEQEPGDIDNLQSVVKVVSELPVGTQLCAIRHPYKGQ